MRKNTRNFMIGVIFGYVGMIMYSLSLTGYEYIEFMDVLMMLKQAIMPFLFTELFVCIGSEGVQNLIEDFKLFRAKLKMKRISKKGAEA